LERWVCPGKMSAPAGNWGRIPGSLSRDFITIQTVFFQIPGSSFVTFCCARWNSSGLAQDTLLNMAVEWAVLLIIFWRYRVQISSRNPANLTADFRVFPYSSQEGSENKASD
jgi:hypothetical protein